MLTRDTSSTCSRPTTQWRLPLWLLAAIALLCTTSWPGTASAQTGVIVDGQGEVTLSWERPTEYEDQTPLPIEEIAGYSVQFGETQGGPYDQTLEISNGGVASTMFSLELSEPTTVYFVQTVLATNGQESGLSNEVAKVFELEVTDERVPNPPTSISVSISMTCTTDTPGVTCEFTVTDP